MKSFHEYLYKYGLHDCEVNDIVAKDGKLIFFFNSGIYELNPTGKESTRTNSCAMIIDFYRIEPLNINNHIEINQIVRRKIDEIDYDDFIEKVRKFKFDIDMNFYSGFCNTILLRGYIGNQKYEVILSEVNTISFTFS